MEYETMFKNLGCKDNELLLLTTQGVYIFPLDEFNSVCENLSVSFGEEGKSISFIVAISLYSVTVGDSEIMKYHSREEF